MAMFGLGWKTQCLRLTFFFFCTHFWDLRLLFIYCAWTVAAKFDFSHSFQPISAHHALFSNSQILLFNNFFIKNRFHGTIHTFKNYFTTVFFSFQFQFSVFSCLQTNPKSIYFTGLALLLFGEHNSHTLCFNKFHDKEKYWKLKH